MNDKTRERGIHELYRQDPEQVCPDQGMALALAIYAPRNSLCPIFSGMKPSISASHTATRSNWPESGILRTQKTSGLQY